MKDLRLIPIVLFALSSLLAVKTLHVLGRGGVEVQGTATALAEEATNTQGLVRMLNNAKAAREGQSGGDGGNSAHVDDRMIDPIITGSSAPAKTEAKEPPPAPTALGQLPISLEEKRKADKARADAEAAAKNGTAPPVEPGAAPGGHAADAAAPDGHAADAAAPADGHAATDPAAPADGHAATTDPAAPADGHAADGAKPADGQATVLTDTAVPAADAPAKPPIETAAPLTGESSGSASERALLERLQARRMQLDELGRELDLRENLLRAAEKRIEDRVNQLKQMEANVGAVQDKKQSDEKVKIKGLVDTYASMKPKDAARIFNTLDTGLLVEVASAMKPAVIGAIMAAMAPDAAARLTSAIANKDSAPASAPVAAAAPADGANLPKIEGTQPQPN